MERWADYYATVLGFKRLVNFTDKQILTEHAALMSTVMRDESQNVTFPINEPVAGKFSHIDEFLQKVGPCVQHMAYRTKRIIETVTELSADGVEFLSIPRSYYEGPKGIRELFKDLPQVDVDALARLQILADRDEKGYILQIFTKKVFGQSFNEFIQRGDETGFYTDSFGVRNFKRLFEAIENEQGR